MLSIKNVTKRFGEVTAVNNLNFDVKRGEVLGIVGQNGAGKSTTFKMIMNFLKPDQGTITIAGQPLDEKIFGSDWFFARGTGPLSGYDDQGTSTLLCESAWV